MRPKFESLSALVSGVSRETRPPVFYGSSSIRLWITLAEDFDPRVLNLGFGGSTLEACDYFFSRLVMPVSPRSLLLYAGDNDLGDGRESRTDSGLVPISGGQSRKLAGWNSVRLRVCQAQSGALFHHRTHPCFE